MFGPLTSRHLAKDPEWVSRLIDLANSRFYCHLYAPGTPPLTRPDRFERIKREMLWGR